MKISDHPMNDAIIGRSSDESPDDQMIAVLNDEDQ
jgi:hypothetical protein